MKQNKRQRMERRIGMAFSAVVLMLAVMVGCKGSAGGQEGGGGQGLSAKDVVGAWSTKELKVKIQSLRGGAKDTVWVIDAEQMAKGRKQRTPVTVINAAGDYREEIYTVSDSLVSAKKGFWHIYQDSLFMRLDMENATQSRYGAERKGTTLKLSTRVDFDGDGQKDDALWVTLRKE
ncbi:MAG: hypothetical protein AAF570_20980 [Bacteroidota bacterium]